MAIHDNPIFSDCIWCGEMFQCTIKKDGAVITHKCATCQRKNCSLEDMSNQTDNYDRLIGIELSGGFCEKCVDKYREDKKKRKRR